VEALRGTPSLNANSVGLSDIKLPPAHNAQLSQMSRVTTKENRSTLSKRNEASAFDKLDYKANCRMADLMPSPNIGQSMDKQVELEKISLKKYPSNAGKKEMATPAAGSKMAAARDQKCGELPNLYENQKPINDNKRDGKHESTSANQHKIVLKESGTANAQSHSLSQARILDNSKQFNKRLAEPGLQQQQLGSQGLKVDKRSLGQLKIDSARNRAQQSVNLQGDKFLRKDKALLEAVGKRQPGALKDAVERAYQAGTQANE